MMRSTSGGIRGCRPSGSVLAGVTAAAVVVAITGYAFLVNGVTSSKLADTQVENARLNHVQAVLRLTETALLKRTATPAPTRTATPVPTATPYRLPSPLQPFILAPTQVDTTTQESLITENPTRANAGSWVWQYTAINPCGDAREAYFATAGTIVKVSDGTALAPHGGKVTLPAGDQVTLFVSGQSGLGAPNVRIDASAKGCVLQ